MAIDNELGGREVTVLPSHDKIWRGMKKGRFTPSELLQTDRVILNTVRWGGAYMCGMGKDWIVIAFGYRHGNEWGEMLESFFSNEMGYVRDILQEVECGMILEDADRDFLSIDRLEGDRRVKLTGEMSTTYVNHDTSYDAEDTSTADAYSFEFESLVSSYPPNDDKSSDANRERIGVGLVHSILVAKHLGVEKLKTTKRYYDRYLLPKGLILRNAIKLLLMQISTYIPGNANIWKSFELPLYDIPIFPYRMQMVALWDQSTN